MKIALKYCGGCNPRYDRAALVQRAKTACPSAVFAPVPARECAATLLVCGCHCACADRTDLPRPVFLCTCESDLAAFLQWLNA